MDEVDGRIILAKGVLCKLSELREPGRMETFLLYLGKGDVSIVIHRRQLPVSGRVGFSVEQFVLGSDGILYYDWFGPEQWDLGPEAGELGIPLRVEKDFLRLSYDSVSEFHGVVMRENFFDELAWRLSHYGVVGFGDVYTIDPDMEVKKSRRLRTR